MLLAMRLAMLLALLSNGAEGLRVPSGFGGHRCSTNRQSTNRREVLGLAAGTIAALPAASFATGNMPAVQGKTSNQDGSVKKAATPEAAKKQIAAGYETIQQLLADFESVTAAGGGDGVRRALGVVGTDSPLYLIECVLEDPNPRPLLQPADERVFESLFWQAGVSTAL